MSNVALCRRKARNRFFFLPSSNNECIELAIINKNALIDLLSRKRAVMGPLLQSDRLTSPIGSYFRWAAVDP